MTAPLWRASRGDPARPAVVFLHGFLGDGSDWAPVVDLVEDDCHCIAVDLPGHGRSPLGDPAAARTEWAGRLGEALPPGPYVLCAYSMGGRLALAALAGGMRLPEGLLLESVNPGITDPAERAARLERDRAMAGRLRSNPVAFLREWYAQPLFGSLAARSDLLARVRMERAGLDAFCAADALEAFSPGALTDGWPVLAGLSCPVLAVAGSLDATYAAAVPRIAAAAPRGAANILPGAGHNSHREDPEAFAAVLHDFIQSLERNPA